MTEMHEAVQVLLTSLETERALYAEMVSLAEQQGEALVYRRTDVLGDITARLGKLANRLRQVEASVGENLGDVASLLGLSAKDANLTLVADHAESALAQPLRDLRDRIGATADRLARLNAINAELFGAALESIRFTFQLLAGTLTPPEPCYPHLDSRRQISALAVDQHA